jgi:hypothetical protein
MQPEMGTQHYTSIPLLHEKSGNGGAEYELTLKRLRKEKNLTSDQIHLLLELLNKY